MNIGYSVKLLQNYPNEYPVLNCSIIIYHIQRILTITQSCLETVGKKKKQYCKHIEIRNKA
jgi:hypothetical protein